MRDREAALKTMLSPRVVAHVGASESGLYPADVFRSLSASEVSVYPVNPNREAVFDVPCLPSVGDLPEPADLAVITVGRELVPEVLSQCVAAAIPAAVIFASGFGESDERGRSLQEEVARYRGRILLLGPNCAGFANAGEGIVAARLYSPLHAGGVSFVSQSGALMMALHGTFSREHAGMRYMVSVGNQLDLGVEDLLLHFAEDPDTTVCTAFLEGITNGARFVEALDRNLANGKPVVLLRSGRTAAGRRVAATHTGALAGSDRILEAVCRQYGAVLVEDVEELAVTARLFEAFGPRLTDRIAYLSQSGGLGSLTADLARSAGIDCPPFSPESERAVREAAAVPVYQRVLNPVDLRGDAMRGRALARSAAPFFDDPHLDGVVLLFAKNPNRQVEQETAASVIDLARAHDKPVIVVWVGDFADGASASAPATELIRRAGVPVFRQPGDAISAIARVVEYYRFRRSYFSGEEVRGSARVS